jgi:DNA replication protein DnaC
MVQEAVKTAAELHAELEEELRHRRDKREAGKSTSWPWEPPMKRQADTFETFDLKRNPGMADAYHAAGDVAAGKRRFAFLVGKSGLGKTHLAIAAANRWWVDGTARFAKVRDLLNVMREAIGASRDPLRGAQTVYGDHLLVLDDMGAHYDTPWVRDALFGLIDWRVEEDLPTIVTSNADAGEFDERAASRLRTGLVVCRGKNLWGVAPPG